MAGGHGGGASFGGSVLPKVAGIDSGVTSDINVTPMIDVMLVLLIIFMVVTPALAYEAKLPKAKMSAPEKDERVTLGVDKNGQYWIEDVPNPGPIPLAQLQGRLQETYTQRGDPNDHTLYLKADNGVRYETVLLAIDAARQAGVRRIGTITELPAGARVVRE
ncbi:biopolymer transporter ExbD [Longimicrobium sp.]|uniref:ExbD/TolR family protein n=1 Tax=Longimicrobium sp. TaxID=2029185 RepID=UPI002E332109|nr:biopolymer transporter ExbD [Longimicrobium sp.]HEX6041275.1 biopolymer transporter ExbD [Longimicrobium sp.]